MKQRAIKYGSIFFLIVAVLMLLVVQRREGLLEKKRERQLTALNRCLSQVRTPLDFQPLRAPTKKKMEALTTFLVKEVLVENEKFAPDAITLELKEHILRIYAMPGGRAWLEGVQRQALFQLHEAQEKK